MDSDIPQKEAPEDVCITHEDLDNRNMHQNQPLYTDSVIQHHEMHSNSTVQHHSSSHPMVPQNARTYLSETVQQHFNNREVHQEVDEPALLATRAHVTDLNNKTSESKINFPAHCDGNAENNIHKCNVCHKGFVSKGNLKKHSSIHTREKAEKTVHKCNVCQKVFVSKSKLKTHVLIHTGEKPYVCEVCSKKFRTKSCLKRHKLLVHTDQRQYVCNICDRNFFEEQDLKDHFWVHTGVKRHLCEICNNRFTTKANLDRHRHQHSKSRLFKRNTEEAETQIIIPTSKSHVSEVDVDQQLQEAQKRINISKTDFAKYLEENAESAVEQQQIIDKEKQINYVKAVSDYSEMLFAENCVSEEQILMNSEEKEHLDYVQEIHSINPTLDAQGFNNMITIDQQDIADRGYHSLPQIGNQTLAEIVPETFSINEQRPRIHDEQPQINYIVPSSSTMFPAEVNQNMHPGSSYAFPCDQIQNQL